MAHVHPSLPTLPARSAGEQAEHELLAALAGGLPDAYTIVHGAEWSQGAGAQERHGELDVVVINQAGDVLLMEVKAGPVDTAGGALVKRYGAERKDVLAQVRGQYNAMRTRLRAARLPSRVHHLLVLPHVRVDAETVQWPRERIVDSTDMPDVVPRVMQALGPGLPDDTTRQRVEAFFRNQFHVVPDVSALAGRLQRATTTLSAGLATWVPRIHAPSGLLRVVGTAGSGKSQLALRLLADADEADQRAAYVCFNRALADHMATCAPVRTPVQTFHEWAVDVCRRNGMVPDFSVPGVFDDVAQRCAQATASAAPDLDLIVLDELQDMQPDWVDTVLRRLRASGRAVLLEDPDQQLYTDREPFDLPDAVTITSQENYRTPRALVRLINLLRLTTTAPVQARSAHEGEVPEPLTYADDAQCLRATAQAVQRCVDLGFAAEDVAVISLRGRGSSPLQASDRIGKWTTRRFLGTYDEGGAPLWTQGELLVDSVRRFKGQAAPAVVLTECDFEQLDAITRRLLFVGMTRARVHLEWVVSERAAGVVRAAATR